MGIVSFKPGSTVYQGTTRYEIVGTFDLNSVLAKNPETGESLILQATSLKSGPDKKTDDDNGGIKTVEHIDPKHWKIAQNRYENIEPLLKDNRTKKEVEDRAKEFQVSADSIYRWIKRFETTGTISSLVPNYEERGGRGKPRTGARQEEIISKTIKVKYLNKQKLKPEAIWKEIKKLCEAENLKPPHKNTIINRINKLPKRETDKAREGRLHSDNLYGAKPGNFPGGDYPLDVIQIDHTPLNVIVVDEEFREAVLRPYLTVAIDVNSRVIVGYYISPDHPSYFSVSQCLTNAFLPKDKFLRSLKVEGNWDVWGKPRVVYADNAFEFRGGDLKQVCMEEYHIILEWRPVKTPEFGGHIERLCGTLNRKIEELPGTTFANIEERGEYDSGAEAVMTIEELERWFADLVVNWYHIKEHTAIGMPPMKKYELGLLGDDSTPGTGLPSAIDDEERLRVSLYPHVKRTIQRNGFVIEGLHYWHGLLRKWINATEGKSKKFFTIKYNPRDMSIVYFYDPEAKMYFPIPFKNAGNKPISLWQWRAAKKFLQKEGIKTRDEAAIFRGEERREKQVEESTKNTKTARRQKTTANFHARKNDEEKKSMEKASGNSTNGSRALEQAKKANLDDIFKDAKPFDGIKVIKS
jgi:putative transposase